MATGENSYPYSAIQPQCGPLIGTRNGMLLLTMGDLVTSRFLGMMNTIVLFEPSACLEIE
jgi:hypothetical protein